MNEHQASTAWAAVVAITILTLGWLVYSGIESSREFWKECLQAGNQSIDNNCVRLAPTPTHTVYKD